MEQATTFIPTHFFKPLLQGFHQGLLIPVAFLKYLNLNEKGVQSDDQHDAVLRTECGEWKVKIKGRQFEDGWAGFANHNDLHVGDFVVFEHQGDLVFNVSVFDPSTCRRKYTKKDKEPERERPLPKDNRICVMGSKEEQHQEARPAFPKVEACSLTHTYPSFRAIMIPSSIRRSELYIPRKFARLNGLSDRHCEMMTIIDGDHDDQRSWQLTLRKSRKQIYLSGWKHIRVANALKLGDNLSFTLVENGERLVMVFNKIKETCGNVKKEPMKQLVAAPTLQHFTYEISPYIFKHSGLNIPVKFAKSNGLTKNCRVTITDPERQQWVVGIRFNNVDGSVRIQHGWRSVAFANKLKAGDVIKLERVKGGGRNFAMSLSILRRSPGEKASSSFKEKPLDQ